MLFFGYGLLSDVDALTIVLAALGAICVASAVLLILELSDPYSGLFRMPHEGFRGPEMAVEQRRRFEVRRPRPSAVHRWLLRLSFSRKQTSSVILSQPQSAPRRQPDHRPAPPTAVGDLPCLMISFGACNAVEGRFACRADLARRHGATAGAFVFAPLIAVFGLGMPDVSCFYALQAFPVPDSAS